MLLCLRDRPRSVRVYKAFFAAVGRLVPVGETTRLHGVVRLAVDRRGRVSSGGNVAGTVHGGAYDDDDDDDDAVITTFVSGNAGPRDRGTENVSLRRRGTE